MGKIRWKVTGSKARALSPSDTDTLLPSIAPPEEFHEAMRKGIAYSGSEGESGGMAAMGLLLTPVALHGSKGASTLASIIGSPIARVLPSDNRPWSQFDMPIGVADIH